MVFNLMKPCCHTVEQANNSIACDKKAPHSSAGCSIINHDDV